MASPTEISALNNYTAALWAIANNIDNYLYPAERKRVGDWEAAARAAGVYEGNIIAVLGPFNVWEAIVTQLSGQTIPLEIKRVQQGGAVPHSDIWAAGNSTNPTWIADLAPYQPPARIVLPDISTMLSGQGGALTGAAQYSAPLSVTVIRQDIAVPTAVAAAPNEQVTSNIAAQYPPPPPATMLPPPGNTTTLPYDTAGIAGPLPTEQSGKTGSGPSTIRGTVGDSLFGPLLDFGGTGTTGGTTGEPDKYLWQNIPWWLWGLGALAAYMAFRRK